MAQQNFWSTSAMVLLYIIIDLHGYTLTMFVFNYTYIASYTHTYTRCIVKLYVNNYSL